MQLHFVQQSLEVLWKWGIVSTYNWAMKVDDDVEQVKQQLHA